MTTSGVLSALASRPSLHHCGGSSEPNLYSGQPGNLLEGVQSFTRLLRKLWTPTA